MLPLTFASLSVSLKYVKCFFLYHVLDKRFSNDVPRYSHFYPKFRLRDGQRIDIWFVSESEARIGQSGGLCDFRGCRHFKTFENHCAK